MTKSLVPIPPPEAPNMIPRRLVEELRDLFAAYRDGTNSRGPDDVAEVNTIKRTLNVAVEETRKVLAASGAPPSQENKWTQEREAMRLRGYRQARIFEPSMDGYAGAMAVFRAIFPDDQTDGDVATLHISDLSARVAEGAPPGHFL